MCLFTCNFDFRTNPILLLLLLYNDRGNIFNATLRRYYNMSCIVTAENDTILKIIARQTCGSYNHIICDHAVCVYMYVCIAM